MPSTSHKKKRPIQRTLIKMLWRYAPGAMFWLRDLGGCTTLKHDTRFLSLYHELYDDGRVLMSIRELYNLYDLGRRAAHLPEGDFAEFGVYKGGSARMLSEIKGDRQLWLFDTFEGMPASDRSIDEFGPGDFDDTSLESVRRYLAAYPNVRYVRGRFPESVAGSGAEESSYVFVNLDVDLYRSTYDGLAFFYPRLVRGGILLSHDYFDLPAVRSAFDDFFVDKPETVLHLFDTQGVVVKL